MPPPLLPKNFFPFVYTILFLFILARLYTFLISQSLVPDYPDPILAFLSRINDRTEILLDPVSHIIGPIVFIVVLRFYREGRGYDRKRGWLIVAGRLVQCAVFVGRECDFGSLGFWQEEGRVCEGDCTGRIFDVLVSMVLGVVELSGWEWDGGLVDAGLDKVLKLVGREPKVVVKKNM